MRALRISASEISPRGESTRTAPEDFEGVPDLELLGDEDFRNELRMGAVEVIERFLQSTEAERRLTFIGRLRRGRAGATLSVSQEGVRISGHKLDPIPDALRIAVEHYSSAQVHEALQSFLSGIPVLIEGDSGSLLLRWDPFLPEVFASGWDSE